MPREFRVSFASDLAEAFATFGVEYLFIGKGAAIVLGYPGTTLDVDVFPARGEANARRIVEALRSLGFPMPTELEQSILANRDFVQIKEGPFELDLVYAPDGIEDFESARTRRIVYENLSVASLEDIIASKKASGRVKDRLDLPQLELFREEFERLHPRPLKNAWEIDRFTT